VNFSYFSDPINFIRFSPGHEESLRKQRYLDGILSEGSCSDSREITTRSNEQASLKPLWALRAFFTS